MSATHGRAVLALLAIAAVVLTAVAVGPLFESTSGGDRPPVLQQSPSNTTSDIGDSGAPLGALLTGVVVVGLFAIAVQFLEEPWNALTQLLGTAIALLALVGGVWLLSKLAGMDLESEGGAPPAQTTTSTPPGTPGLGQGSGGPAALPVDGSIAVIVVVAAIAAALVFARRSETFRAVLAGEDAAGDESDDADLASVARVAGDTADRVEAAETASAADNAIYRAWREMIELLDVGDPREATPRAFETMAIEAGMDPEDVGVLTRTFEAVRYGDASLTDERRERAVAALERIEATHADDRADGGGDGT